MGETWSYVKPWDEITVEWPRKDALLLPADARKTERRDAIVTREGHARVGDVVVPLPQEYRVRQRDLEAAPAAPPAKRG